MQTTYKNNGYFFAILDGKMFEMRDEDKYRAELLNKTGAINHSVKAQLNRVATSVIFYGNQFKDAKGKLFDENLEFEFSFDEGALGEPNDLKIEAHYELNDYYHLPEYTRFKISSIDWSSDRREFLMNAEFDCKMRKWGFPAESQPVVRIKGKMVGVAVTVPPWIKLKDPNQVVGK